MIWYRVKTVTVRHVPGTTRSYEFPLAYTPLRLERRRVEFHLAYLRNLEPTHEHRLQEIRIDLLAA